MNVGSWLVWGFGATVVLTTIMAASQALHLTRMNIPFLLGTVFTTDRDRAGPIGVVAHLLNGWVFSLGYVAAFHAWPSDTGWPQWVVGACVGLVHATFVLAVAMPVLPGLHPHMASATRGATARRELEPPGFLALNYGVRTPVSILLAHLAFGAMLGLLYRPA